MAFNYRPGDEPVPGYSLVRFLGKGAIGEVWQAAGPGGTEVALKMIDLSGSGTHARKEFRALQLVKRIHHPNLVPVIAAWVKLEDGTVLTDTDAVHLPGHSTAPGSTQQTMAIPPSGSGPLPKELIIAMGLGRQSLADRLDECQQQGLSGLPFDELIGYMEDAAKAIDFLNSPVHQTEAGRGAITHCDIKPLNMLIVGGAVQVCDFGLAHIVGKARSTAAAMGTIAYVAPELLEGKPSPATDQYCLAVSYYELRTGSLPYVQETPSAVMRAVIDGDLDFSKVPAGEQDVLRKATALKSGDRHGSAMEMVHRLAETMHPGLPLPASRPSGRRTKVAFLGTAVVVLAVVAAIVASRLWPPSPTSKWVEATLAELRKSADKLGYPDAFRSLALWENAPPSPAEYADLKQRFLEQFYEQLNELKDKSQFASAVRLLVQVEQAVPEFVPDAKKRFAELVDGWMTLIFSLLACDRPDLPAAEKLLRAPPDPPPHDHACELWGKYLLAVLDSWNERKYAATVDALAEGPSSLSAEQRLHLRGAVLADWAQQVFGMPADSPDDWRELFKKFAEFSAHADDVAKEDLRGKLIVLLKEKAKAEDRGINDELKMWLALLKDSANALGDDTSLTDCRTKLLDRWWKQVNDRIKQKEWAAAWTDLNLVPEEQSGGQTAILKAMLREKWRDNFRSVLATSIVDAERLLDPAPSWIDKIDPKLVPSLRVEIADAKSNTLTAQRRSLLAKNLEAKLFHEAFALLGQPPPVFSEDEDKKYRDKIRSEWLGEANRLFASGKPDDKQKCVETLKVLLVDFPTCYEARLLYARVLIGRQQYAEALKELKQIPAAAVQNQYRRLWEALSLLAEAKDPARPLSGADLKKRLAALDGFPPSSPPWDLNDGETAALNGLAPPPPPPPPPIVEPKPPDVVPSLLADVEDLLNKNDFERARKTLSVAESKGAPPDRVARLKKAIALRESIALLVGVNSDAKEIARGLDLAEDLLAGQAFQKNRPTPAEAHDVCKAIAELRSRSFAGEVLAGILDRAIRITTATYVDFRHDSEIAPDLTALWTKRIALYVDEAELLPPGGDQFKFVQSQLKELEDAGVLNGDVLAVADAWECECQGFGSRENPLARFVIRHGIVRENPYVSYVRASATKAAGNPNLDDILKDLADVFSPTQLPAVMLKGDRLVKAAELAIESLDGARWKWRRAAQFGNPFLKPDYDLLVGVHSRLTRDDVRLKLAAGSLEKLKVFLGIAALGDSQANPNLQLSRDLTADLLQGGGGNLKKEYLLPVLAAYLRARLPVSPESPLPPDLLNYCTQLLDMYAESIRGAPNQDDAKRLYGSIFEPVRAAADQVNAAGAAASDRPRWALFYAAAGNLFWKHQSPAWPVPGADVNKDALNELVEKLLSRAIEFSPDLPGGAVPAGVAATLSGYYVTRGEARIGRTVPDLQAVIRDADKALDLDPNQRGASWLRGLVWLLRSREQSTRDGRVKYLTEAVKAGMKAIDGCGRDDRSFTYYHLGLSMAYLERANYESESAQVAADLKGACDCAEQAAPESEDSPLAYKHFLALGNAYEDLGYFLDRTPTQTEEDFQRAIKAFQRADDVAFAFQRADNVALGSSQGLPKNVDRAVACLSVGRVYYRSAAQTWLPRPTLGKKTTDELVDECKRRMTDAIAFDPDCLEAYSFLGQASQFQFSQFQTGPFQAGQAQEAFKDADAFYLKANLKSKNTRSHALYVYYWALLPLARPGQDEKAWKDAWDRAEELDSAPPSPGGAVDPLKAKAHIRALVHLKRHEYDKAKAECDGRLPKGKEQADLSDISLLLTRAECNLALAKPGRDKALAGEAIVDARRAGDAAVLSDRGSRLSACQWEAEGHTLVYQYSESAEEKAASEDAAIKAYGRAVQYAVRLAQGQVQAERICQRVYDEFLHDKMARLLTNKAPLKDLFPAVKQTIEWRSRHLDLLRRRGETDKKLVEELRGLLTLGIACAKDVKDQSQADAWQEMLDATPAPPGKKT